MKIVKLEGVLMDNGEFICCGKPYGFLNDKQLKYVTEVKEV